MRDLASHFGFACYRIAGGSPKAGNKVAPNVVISLISPPSTRSTSILNARYSASPARRGEWSAGQLSTSERELLDQFIDAHERCDAAAAVAIAARDIRVTMPPYSLCYDGVDAIAPLLDLALGPDREGDWRLVPTGANRMPAAASYLRRPGDTKFRAFKIDVLRVDGKLIREITTFGAPRFPAFGLPPMIR